MTFRPLAFLCLLLSGCCCGGLPVTPPRPATTRQDGLSEFDRREIYRRSGENFVRSMNEADARLGIDTSPGKGPVGKRWLELQGKHAEIQESLDREYNTALAKEYGITQARLAEILLEGDRSGWPKPSR